MKKLFAGFGALSVPFSAMSSVAFAEDKADTKQQKQYVVLQANESNVSKINKGDVFSGIVDIKNEEFSLRKASLQDVGFMAENMPKLQNERWLKYADLIRGQKTKQQWKELFTERLQNNGVTEEFFIKDKTGTVVGGVEVHKLKFDNISYDYYLCHFVGLGDSKKVIEKAARKILEHVRNDIGEKEKVAIEFLAHLDSGNTENEYEKFCEDLWVNVGKSYRWRIKKEERSGAENRGVKFFILGT